MATVPLEELAAPSVATATIESGLELVPIPAVHVVRSSGGFRFEAVNRAYKLAGLGVQPQRSPMLAALGGRIDRFLSSADLRENFDWSIGDAIDCRYYRVTIARSTASLRDRCTVTFVDQTSQLNTERSLRREMTTDSLTGLPNREGFSDLIEQVGDTLPEHAVMVVDLDRFGRLNACLGGLVGDELLITVARRMKGALRARDTLARIGGDEFGILLKLDDSPDEVRHVAQRIQTALAVPFRLTDYEISVECSIGIAFGADAPEAGEELIRHAQFAVKRAKATGKTEAYQPQAFTIAREQFGMETALRRAIEDRRLRLTFQPIHDLATGRLVSFESLARWTDEEGRDIEPSRFIPVAEESGLIVPLGRWAIDEAARVLAGWDAATGGNCGVRIAVNLSAIQLGRDVIAPVVERALAANRLEAARFTLELTESALITDPDRVAGTMRALKELGTTLAMDDFGTGYSNLAYLQLLPIDVLKIDRSFITGMLADRDKTAIVRAILSLAQALGMSTTAEGVETLELARMLAVLGCTYGQGYHFARALEADAALALIAPPAVATAAA